MASCLPSNFNIPGPRIKTDNYHATQEMWEPNTWHDAVQGATWGLLLGREMFLIKLSDLVESSHK